MKTTMNSASTRCKNRHLQVTLSQLMATLLTIFFWVLPTTISQANSQSINSVAPIAFSWVDVFAIHPFNQPATLTGNATRVVRNAGSLSDIELKYVTGEFGAETQFVLSPREIEGSWPTRVFQSDGTELNFSGSAALGAAADIRSFYFHDKQDSIVLNYTHGVGKIVVTFEGAEKVPFFTTGPATFGQDFSSSAQEIADIFFKDVSPSARLAKINQNFPIQIVNAGLPWIVVPINSLADIQSATLNPDAEKAFATNHNLPFALFALVTKETADPANQLHVRAMAGFFGFEDTATGTAGSDIAAWTAKYNYLGTSVVNVQSEQGSELGRPSLLFYQATAQPDGSVQSTKIGGTVEKAFTGIFSPNL